MDGWWLFCVIEDWVEVWLAFTLKLPERIQDVVRGNL